MCGATIVAVRLSNVLTSEIPQGTGLRPGFSTHLTQLSGNASGKAVEDDLSSKDPVSTWEMG